MKPSYDIAKRVAEWFCPTENVVRHMLETHGGIEAERRRLVWVVDETRQEINEYLDRVHSEERASEDEIREALHDAAKRAGVPRETLGVADPVPLIADMVPEEEA